MHKRNNQVSNARPLEKANIPPARPPQEPQGNFGCSTTQGWEEPPERVIKTVGGGKKWEIWGKIKGSVIICLGKAKTKSDFQKESSNEKTSCSTSSLRNWQEENHSKGRRAQR